MNETFNEALKQILDRAMSGVDTAVDFLSGEVPEVIYELLLWYGVYKGITSIAAVVLLFVVYKVIMLPWKARESSHKLHDFYYSSYSGSLEPTAMINMFAAAILGPIAICAINLEWLQILIAPRIWLIEYAANLVG